MSIVTFFPLFDLHLFPPRVLFPPIFFSLVVLLPLLLSTISKSLILDTILNCLLLFFHLSMEIDRNVRQKTSSILRPSEFAGKAMSSFSSSNEEKFMGVTFSSIQVTVDPTTMDDWRTLHPSEALEMVRFLPLAFGDSHTWWGSKTRGTEASRHEMAGNIILTNIVAAAAANLAKDADEGPIE